MLTLIDTISNLNKNNGLGLIILIALIAVTLMGVVIAFNKK